MIKIRKFDIDGNEIATPPAQKFTYGSCMPRVHKEELKTEAVEIITPVIELNNDIIQAKVDKNGILQRPDYFTGENLNEIIDFKKNIEKKKDINESKTKYIPGERLLLTIKQEKPELLERSEYKSITTKKRNKLKNILGKLN